MKKVLSIIMSVLMCFCAFISVSAKDELIEHASYGIRIDDFDPGSSYNGYFSGCFIRNEYYSHFADYYFEKQYDFYKDAYDYWTGEKTDTWYERQREFIKDSNGNNKTFAYDITPDKMNGHIYYQTVIFNYDCEPDAVKNKAFAENLSDGMEVLYIGNTTPCAVVVIRGGTDDFANIIENENVEFFFDAFDDSDNRVYNCAVFEETYAPDAAHARRVLRYSAGLEEVPAKMSQAKEFFFMSDTDFDGKITAADARTALRIAAKIETGHTLVNYHDGCGAWWAY